MTDKTVADGKTKMTDEEFGHMNYRFREIERRVNQGTIEYDQVMNNLQLVVENRVNESPDFDVLSDLVVTVDRVAPPVYMKWEHELIHPDYELVGPSRFSLASLESCFHPYQNEGRVKGSEIYRFLKEEEKLENCLGLADLEVIRKLGSLGVAFLGHHFKNGSTETPCFFGWRSVVKFDGKIHVPYLLALIGKMSVVWTSIENFITRDPALLFPKTMTD